MSLKWEHMGEMKKHKHKASTPHAAVIAPKPPVKGPATLQSSPQLQHRVHSVSSSLQPQGKRPQTKRPHTARDRTTVVEQHALSALMGHEELKIDRTKEFDLDTQRRLGSSQSSALSIAQRALQRAASVASTRPNTARSHKKEVLGSATPNTYTEKIVTMPFHRMPEPPEPPIFDKF